MNSKHHYTIRIERDKLYHLVDEAIENGTPIDKTHAIMDQCVRIKRLVLRGKLENYLRKEEEG